MKLLDKKTIQVEKASERKKEIDEGVKLAKKIDKLREESSSEEGRLAKFREASLKKIRDDISKLSEEKSSLSLDIITLTAQRDKLKEPLDKEWNVVNNRAKDLETLNTQLFNKEVLLNQKEKSLVEKEKELKLEEERVLDLQERANDNYDSSIKELAKVKKQSEDLEKRERETDEGLRERTRIVSLKETKLEAREIDFKNVQLAIQRREEVVRDKEVQLKDREELLERNIKRKK
jgi:uncharacterized protein (DUF3084 family)